MSKRISKQTSKQWTRRDFVRQAAGGVTAAAVAAGSRPATGQESRAGAPAGEIAVHLTAGDSRFAPQPALRWRRAGAPSGSAIVLDPSVTNPELLGFGAAFTDASCYLFNQLPADKRERLFHELFHPSEMGLSVGRTCVGSSDYSTSLYSFDEGAPDVEMQRFSIEHDREYILPMLRQARTVNPDLFLLASPWSPPGWMKPNGSMLGGSMRKKYFAPYALYLEKFLRAYADAGVPIQAITTQNEVDTDQDGRMPACLWGQEYEIEFIARHLGPRLAASGLATKIWLLDHNYNLWGRVVCELNDPDVSRYVEGVAWHGYAGSPDAMRSVFHAYPWIHAYWTEGGPDYTDPAYATEWAKWSTTFTGILRNDSRCIIGWNLALDEHGKPNIGPFACGGLVTIHSQTREVTRSGQYWAFAHYSRVLRRGARRVDSRYAQPVLEDILRDVTHVAFTNPDGGKVAVLTNTGNPTATLLTMNGMETEISLPANSVATLSWR